MAYQNLKCRFQKKMPDPSCPIILICIFWQWYIIKNINKIGKKVIKNYGTLAGNFLKLNLGSSKI